MNPMVGRKHIQSALSEHLDDTLHGSGGCLALEGPIGVGRTRLLKATAMAGADRGLTVAYVRATGGDQPEPIRKLITFLRHVTQGGSELEELARADDNPFWLTDRLGGLIESAAHRRPLLVVLDDAHLADEVSGLALQGLVPSLVSSPVLWVLARRPVPSHSLAQHAISWLIDRAAARLDLGPLDNEAVAALCANVLGAKPDSSVLDWAARCCGNPWLLENLFGALMEAGQVVIVDGTASVLGGRLPEGVLTAVDHLLDELPPTVRRLLVYGGHIGPTFTIDEVAAMLGESAPDLPSSLEEAVQAGLLQRSGTKLTFVHDVIGEAVQQIASRSLEPASSVPSTDTGVGQPAQIGAPHADTERPAIDRAVVEGSVPAPPQRPACGCDEIVEQAISTLGDLFDQAPHKLARALGLLVGAGRDAEAARLADAIVRAGLDPPVESLPDAGPTPGIGASINVPQPRVPAHQLESGSDTGATGRRVSAAESPQVQACPYCGTGERPLWTWLVRALVGADQFEEAAAACAAIKKEAEKLGVSWREPLWHGHRAELLVAVGRLDEACAEAEAGLRLKDCSAPEDAVPAHVVMARISVHRDDMDTASEHLRTAEQLVTDDAVADKARLDWALAQFHSASGRQDMAVHTLIGAETQPEPDLLLFSEVPTASATVVRLGRQVGFGAEAERAADLALHLTKRNPAVTSLAAGAEHARGLLHRDADTLHHAVEHYRHSARPLATAVALEDSARGDQNGRAKARTVQLLESALDLYLACGAHRDITRVQKTLRRLGVHQVRTLGTDRPKSGWESLTTAELRVVRAIVDGKTNKEAASTLFLSPHTVDSHLRRVFAKLNINSRVELTKQFIANETSAPVQPSG